jgi:hypothetical protein
MDAGGGRKVVGFPVGHGRLDRAYWLSRCEHFRVEQADGTPIGRVEELRYRSRLDEPDELTVRLGLFGLRRLTFPVEAVRRIHASQRRLTLAPGATARSEPSHPHDAT